MFGTIQNYLILALIIVLFLVGGYALVQQERAKAFKDQAEDRESAMKVKERDWVTEKGRLVHENSVASFKSDKVAKEFLKQDSATNALLKDLNVKWRKVQSLSNTITHNHYHIDNEIINNGDSTYTIPEWKNNYLKVSGVIDLKKNIVSLDYDHKDTITQVIHYKRSKKLLGIIPYGRLTFVSETTCADSSSKIVDQTTFVRDRK
jgi:hypothetical protein